MPCFLELDRFTAFCLLYFRRRCSFAPGGKHSAAVVRERIATLGHWLTKVLEVEGVLACMAAECFLELPIYTPFKGVQLPLPVES